MRQWLIPAVGVALSPLPILALLLALGSRRPLVLGGAFWIAWTIGIAVPTVAFVVVAERADAIDDDLVAIALAEIAIGAVLLAVAVRLAFWRPRERRDAPPRWLDALDRAGPLRVAGLALILSSGSPKNLALMLGAAVAIVRERTLVLGTAGFVALAASTVSLVLAGYAASSGRSARTLARLRGTVARNDRTIAVVVGLVVGTFFLVEGIRGL